MRVGLFCKTFRRDFTRFGRLLQSVERHARGELPFLVSVPREDKALFVQHFGSRRVEWVTDEELVGRRIRQNWRTQQVVKLNVWRTGFADVFAMLDSDFYFIREFGPESFVAPDGTPRFVVSRHWHKYDRTNAGFMAELRGERTRAAVTREECARLLVDGAGPARVSRLRLWMDRLTSPPVVPRMKRIREVFRRTGPDYYVMPGPVWTRAAHAQFFEGFVREQKLDYFDLIQFSPWEYVWIAEWLLSRGLPDLTPTEPMFLHFDSDADILHARGAGFTERDFARSYLGLGLAANHQRIEAF